jgi:hypothetical protein
VYIRSFTKIINSPLLAHSPKGPPYSGLLYNKQPHYFECLADGSQKRDGEYIETEQPIAPAQPQPQWNERGAGARNTQKVEDNRV